jgi:hypothetical protein
MRSRRCRRFSIAARVFHTWPRGMRSQAIAISTLPENSGRSHENSGRRRTDCMRCQEIQDAGRRIPGSGSAIQKICGRIQDIGGRIADAGRKFYPPVDRMRSPAAETRPQAGNFGRGRPGCIRRQKIQGVGGVVACPAGLVPCPDEFEQESAARNQLPVTWLPAAAAEFCSRSGGCGALSPSIDAGAVCFWVQHGGMRGPPTLSESAAEIVDGLWGEEQTAWAELPHPAAGMSSHFRTKERSASVGPPACSYPTPHSKGVHSKASARELKHRGGADGGGMGLEAGSQGWGGAVAAVRRPSVVEEPAGWPMPTSAAWPGGVGRSGRHEVEARLLAAAAPADPDVAGGPVEVAGGAELAGLDPLHRVEAARVELQ